MVSGDLKIAFINPLSVDNLALYDISLLKGVLNSEPGFLIRYYGNREMSMNVPDSVDFVPVYRYRKLLPPLNGISYLLSQLILIASLKRFRPDVIHCQWPRSLLVDRLTWVILKVVLKFTVIIHTAHNVLPHDAVPSAADSWCRLYRGADGIIVHHKDASDALSRKFAIPTNKLAVIPHGLLRFPIDRFSLTVRTHELRCELSGGSEPGKPIIAFLGYIRTYKGLDLLLDALEDSALRSSGRFLIAGAGDIPSLKEWPEITLRNEFLDINEFLACLNAADLVVLPYRHISQSGLLMTAIAEGVPVLVSDRGGMAETVIKYGAGWVLEELNVAALRKKLLSLLSNPTDLVKSKKTDHSKMADIVKQEWNSIGRLTAEFYKETAIVR